MELIGISELEEPSYWMTFLAGVEEFFFFRCALFDFRGFAIRGLDIPRDTFYVCFMHGRRKFFHVIFHGFRGNRGECNTLCVL